MKKKSINIYCFEEDAVLWNEIKQTFMDKGSTQVEAFKIILDVYNEYGELDEN